MKSDSHACDIEHRQIIRAITHRHDLIQRNILGPGNGLEQFGLLLAINKLACDSACNHAIFDFQVVGKNMINS